LDGDQALPPIIRGPATLSQADIGIKRPPISYFKSRSRVVIQPQTYDPYSFCIIGDSVVEMEIILK
jgi:hypothetical protein